MASWSPADEGEYAPQHRADPKPARRHKASQSEWAAIREGFGSACCVHCGLSGQSLHHILPRSQGGDDAAVNLVPLCGDGTRGCHGLLEGHGSGWERVAASVRQYVITNPERLRYQTEHAGESFNRRYPPLPNTDPQFEQDFRAIYRMESL